MSENVLVARVWIGILIFGLATLCALSLLAFFTHGLATAMGGIGFGFVAMFMVLLALKVMTFTTNCWVTIMESNDKKRDMDYIKQANQLKIG